MWTQRGKREAPAADRKTADPAVRQMVTAWVQALEATDAQVPLGTVACPALGLATDHASHCLFETMDHRCYQSGRAAKVPGEVQRRYCLTSQYADCPVFQGAQRAWVRRRFGWLPWYRHAEEQARPEELRHAEEKRKTA
jgi:hypothetical protein